MVTIIIFAISHANSFANIKTDPPPFKNLPPLLEVEQELYILIESVMTSLSVVLSILVGSY